ncbi:MAG TPA: ABC-2 family transporter protein [Pirellulales bacterium]|jgi:ABC-2 type transport system permease protein|nr:ABC-2 family transporter protein [Pirellulales bacterium]
MSTVSNPAASNHPPTGPISLPPSTIRSWWIMLRISLEERLVYRGDFILGTLMRFLPVVTQVFLWTAIFSAVKATGSGNIGGYDQHEVIAYFLLTMVGRAFSSMPGLASGIARSIRDGSIKKYLIQPVDMIMFLFLGRVAHKLVYYLVATLPFALVFFICRDYFSGWPDAGTLLAFVAALIMSFVLGFFLEATIGMIGFWFLEVSSLLFVYMLFSFFLAGQMFPLTMLNKIHFIGSLSWGDVVLVTPFQYLAYFPAAVFLGKIHGAELARGLSIELAWCVGLILVCRWAFKSGVKRYSAFGG